MDKLKANQPAGRRVSIDGLLVVAVVHSGIWNASNSPCNGSSKPATVIEVELTKSGANQGAALCSQVLQGIWPS